MFVKPSRPGLLVRDPRSLKPLPESGKEVPLTTFWVKRLATGDVVEVQQTSVIRDSDPAADAASDEG